MVASGTEGERAHLIDMRLARPAGFAAGELSPFGPTSGSALSTSLTDRRRARKLDESLTGALLMLSSRVLGGAAAAEQRWSARTPPTESTKLNRALFYYGT